MLNWLVVSLYMSHTLLIDCEPLYGCSM